MTDSTPGGRRGPAPIAIGLVGLFALVIVAGAVIVLMNPGSVPSGSPAPVGTATAAASPSAAITPGPTAAVTAAPTPSPVPSPTSAATSAASTGPSVAPTVEPTTSSPPLAASCRNDAAGLTASYPATWYAYTGDATWTCLLFDRAPVVIPVQSELPLVGVTILPVDAPASEVRASLQDPTYWTVLRTDATVVDGFAASVLELEATGEGFDEKGMLEFAIVVDLGATRSLTIDTRGRPGAVYDENVEVLLQMAAALEID